MYLIDIFDCPPPKVPGKVNSNRYDILMTKSEYVGLKIDLIMSQNQIIIIKRFLVAHSYINIPKTIGHKISVNKRNTDRNLRMFLVVQKLKNCSSRDKV